MSSLKDKNGIFFCDVPGRCRRCGGALGELEGQECVDSHVSLWDCIYVLQNTLNRHMENTIMLENTICELLQLEDAHKKSLLEFKRKFG
jgi:hypothetical protein